MCCVRELELEMGDTDLARVQNCLHRLASLQIEARSEAKPIEQLEGQCCQLVRTFRPSLSQKSSTVIKKNFGHGQKVFDPDVNYFLYLYNFLTTLNYKKFSVLFTRRKLVC
jgi:hypothetical protein